MLQQEKEVKHYTRMEGFLQCDIEGRTLDEQKVILEQTIRAANNMLKTIESK